MKKQSFLFLFILFMMIISLNASTAFAYSVTLSWDAPTTNADGTPLTDLAGYKVYYGIQSHNYNHETDVGNVTTYTISNLNIGVTYYFATTSYNTGGNESAYSNEIFFAKYSLTVSKGGRGMGIVETYPIGIKCGLQCKRSYRIGKVVTLIAKPFRDSTFAGWSGEDCSGSGTCTITMNVNKKVTATFEPLYLLSPQLPPEYLYKPLTRPQSLYHTHSSI